MPGTPTSRLGLPTIAGATDAVSGFPSVFNAAVGVLNGSILYSQDTLANRPASPSATPAVFMATDTGVTYWWSGSAWSVLPLGGGSPVGSVSQYAGSSDPVDADNVVRWLICDGRAISRTAYTGYTAKIGTTWGAGDGSTTVNIPDLRGRVAVGAGTGSGLTNRPLGDMDGEEQHQLSSNESVVFPNQIISDNYNNYSSQPGFRAVSGWTETAGGGKGYGHNNMQPFAALNHIIKVL